MSLAGVRSNRGDIYQTLVAFDWAISILASEDYLWLEVDTTSLDTIGNAISVDDIVIGCVDGNLICCQCKKNHIDYKSWSVADLGDELVKAAQFLEDNPNSRVKFFSRSNFGGINKLREHSETQPNEKAYKTSLTNEHQGTDKELEKQISKAAGLSTYDFLQRTAFSVSPGFDDMERQLRDRLNYIVSNGNIAFNALWTKLDKLGGRINGSPSSAQSSHRLTKKGLRETLENSGATLTPPITQQEIQHTFANASAIGRNWKRDIAGKRLQTIAVTELISLIESELRSVLLTGIPGSGKTCTLLELQDVLESRNDLATLFIQAREYAKRQTRESPKACLKIWLVWLAGWLIVNLPL